MRLTLLAILLASIPAQARTGNELMDDCRKPDTDHELVCLGYIQGAMDAFATADLFDRVRARAANNTNHKPNYCLPSNVTTGQVKAIVLKHGNANPEILHNPGDWLIQAALNKSFPCK